MFKINITKKVICFSVILLQSYQMMHSEENPISVNSIALDILKQTHKVSYIDSMNLKDIDWSTLKFGKHKVGFRSSWKIDYSRTVVYDGNKINRPILVNIWYPSEDSAEEESASYMDYFDIESSETGLVNITKDYKAYNLSILSNALIGKSKTNFTKVEGSIFNKFLQARIAIQKGATSKKGKYPLIIYHQGNGTSFEDNSILAQFLASNGYVVIGSSFFKENINSFSIDGNEQSVQDIYYLINYASKLQNVDITNIALMGHSAGAQASFRAKSNTDNLIKVVVSIDTTQETFGLSDTRWDNFTKPVIKNISSMNGSILGFADHKAIFQLYDLMSSADRYYITFPETLNHDEYISQGIFTNFLNLEIQENHKRAASHQHSKFEEDQSNYIKVNNYILDFIQWKLKNIEPPENTFKDSEYVKSFDFKHPFIQNVPINKISAEPYSFDAHKLPTPRQIWSMARTNDIDSLIFTLNHFKRTNAKNPIYHDIFAFALISQLIAEDHLKDAKRIFNFYKEEKTPITERFISLGKFSIMMGSKDYAQKCFSNLLKLEPENAEAKIELEKIQSFND